MLTRRPALRRTLLNTYSEYALRAGVEQPRPAQAHRPGRLAVLSEGADSGDGTRPTRSASWVRSAVRQCFAFAVGAPLALAGIRLWRVTTGMGVGLAVALCGTSLPLAPSRALRQL